VNPHAVHHPFFRQAEPLGGGGQNPPVGLMRDQPVHVSDRHIIGGQNLFGDVLEGGDRHLEDFATAHFHKSGVLAGLIITAGHACRDPQQFLVTAISAQATVNDTGFIRRCQHHRAGAVAEQDAGATIRPVNDAGKGVRPHHQRPLRRAGADEAMGDIQSVDETGAHCLHIKGGAAMATQPMLQLGGDAGKDMIGRGGAQDNQVNITRFEARCCQRPTGGLFGQIAGGFPRRSDVALLDAGAFDDPMGRGLDLLFEIGVGQDFFRQIAASSNNSGVIQSACLSA